MKELTIPKESKTVKLLKTPSEWQEVARVCESLGTKTILQREFKTQINWYAFEVVSGLWTKGLIGIQLANDPEVKAKFEELVNKFDIKHIIYTSHQSRSSIPGYFGQSYIMVPVGDYKTLWSPQVTDIYSNLKTYQKEGKLEKFPIDSYVDQWPTQPSTEVLVDCDTYYLIHPGKFLELAGKKYHGSTGREQQKKDIENIKTYDDLSSILNTASKWQP